MTSLSIVVFLILLTWYISHTEKRISKLESKMRDIGEYR